MSARNTGQTSPLSVVTLVVLSGVLAGLLRPEGSNDTSSASVLCLGNDCPATAAPVAAGAAGMSAAEACPAAGYLCAALTREDELRVYRWGDRTEPLIVQVEVPRHESPERAAALQRAAVRGIQAWQGQPFPLVIRDRAARGRGAVDIRVTWQAQLDGTTLGTTRTTWEATGPLQGDFTAVSFVLATRSPYSRAHALSPDDVLLVAAHEMGHALGLPHSDDPDDVMYPTNTASRLSARDYRTMEALYSLPNGQRIRAD